MDNETRLMRVLAAATLPARDPAFVLAVMRRTEQQRYRVERVRALLRGAGLAAAAAALAVPSIGWAAAYAEALQAGALAFLALVALVWATRSLAQRASAAWAG